MHWELDHVFVATPDPGLEAMASVFGLTFTDHRRHLGQGTANACAPFENAFLELLFPADPRELEADEVRPLGLRERIDWKRTGACPFGICFRPLDASALRAPSPFDTWPYRPAYVPPGSSIPIVTPRDHPLEPLVFLMSRPRAAGSVPGSMHLGSRRTLTAVTVHSPHASLSPPVRWFADRGLISVVHAKEYLLEMVWDHGMEGRSARPASALPLAVRW